MNIYKQIAALCAAIVLTASFSFAQDKEGKLTLNFQKDDSLYTCTVTVTSADLPVKDVNVKLYVKRLFSLLPVGSEETTDESGVATFNFPKDIPGGSDGKLTVIAKIEDDENLGSLETKSDVNWGVIVPNTDKIERSISASRGRAPIYFIIASNLIIAGIWGTLIYVIFQIFKIRKISKHLAKNK